MSPGSLSDSGRRPSASPHSTRIGTDSFAPQEDLSLARESPTVGRSVDLDDGITQDERQRIMDVDSAMQLLRAQSITTPSHPHPPRPLPHHSGSNASHNHRSSVSSSPHRPHPSEVLENPFPMLSDAEEQAMYLARGGNPNESYPYEVEDSHGSASILNDGGADDVDLLRTSPIQDMRISNPHLPSSFLAPELGTNYHDPMLEGFARSNTLHATYSPIDPVIGSLGTHDPKNHASSAPAPISLQTQPNELPEGSFPVLPPTYQPTNYLPNFDFSLMEAFAADQRAARSPTSPFGTLSPTGAEIRRRLAQSGILANAKERTRPSLAHHDPMNGDLLGGSAEDPSPPGPSSSPAVVISSASEDAGTGPGTHDAADTSRFAQRRQRKLSQSNATPRRPGKLALFENGHAGDHSFGGHGGSGTGYSSSRPTHRLQTNDSGHDQPYRFSFYSNASSATIHARNLSELPADGQSFEDLFLGRRPGAASPPARGTNQTTPTDRTPRPGTPAIGPRAQDSSLISNVNGGHASKLREGLLAKAVGVPGGLQGLPARPGIFSTTGTSTPVGNGGPIVGPDGGGPGLGGPGLGGVGGPGDPGFVYDPDASTWWLDVLCPTDEEMKMLSKVFNIHPLTTEDIQMEEAREKIELFRNYYFVCFRGFDQDPYSPTHLEPLNMYIVVFREGIISFHFRGTPHPQNVRRRIKQLRDYINVTSDWISYALIDDITDAFGPLIQNIEYEVDSIDELVLILKDTEQSDMLRRIGTCRKKVMGLLRLMGNKADVVKGLAKRSNENWSVAPKSDIGLYLSDIQDHLVTMTQNLNHYEKILSRSHSNYLAQISIEMTDANNQINDVLSKLTALGTVLVPMNLITGLWGMNVHVPGQDIEEGYVWFGSIIGALVGFGVLGFIFAYKLMVSK